MRNMLKGQAPWWFVGALALGAAIGYAWSKQGFGVGAVFVIVVGVLSLLTGCYLMGLRAGRRAAQAVQVAASEWSRTADVAYALFTGEQENDKAVLCGILEALEQGVAEDTQKEMTARVASLVPDPQKLTLSRRVVLEILEEGL